MKIYFEVIGLLCLMLAVWLCARRVRAQFFGAVAVGTVVGYKTRESDDSIFQLPIVTFFDAMGEQHQFTSVAGSVSKSPALGSEVTVRYLPSSPEIAYLSGFLHMWAAPIALVVLGIAGIYSACQL